MNAINTPIPLGDVNIEITVRSQPVQTVAQVYLRLLPKPRLILECEVRDDKFGLGLHCDPEVNLLDQGICLHTLLIRRQSKGGLAKLTFTPTSEPCTVLKQVDQQLQSVTFDILNFSSFIGPKYTFADFATESVKLEADGWRIEITAVPDLKEIIEALNEQGGYGVTHKGALKRLNGETFSIEDAENAMVCLWRFLSFARGLFCGPILPVGINHKGDEVWKQWGCRTVASWGWTHSWFDTDHAKALAEVFPGFWKCLNGGTHADAARIALSWYLRSNRNDGDAAGGLILSQTALERLADAYDFKKKKGESVVAPIKRLIQEIGIPSELPDGLDTLKEVLLALTTKDGGGPEALVAVRNDLVHPKEKLAGISGFKEYEAWNLAQWYVELILLKMFGFNGKYGKRLSAERWSGQVEPVPWVKEAPE